MTEDAATPREWPDETVRRLETELAKADGVYADMQDELRQVGAERDALRAQLAQVEGENARLREALRLAAVELEHGRTRAVRGDIERDGHTVSERNGYVADSARRVERALRAALEATPPAELETIGAGRTTRGMPPADTVPVPVCATCNDTHRMVMETRGMVACTRCPTPCERCRGRRSAFCDKTPCACECHRALLGAGR